MAAQHWLDQLQNPARLAAAVAEPAEYARRLADELPAASPEAPAAEALRAVEARDTALRAGLIAVDAMTERAFRIGMEHALADDTSIPATTRKVFAATILNYADRLELLATRARDIAARGGARDPGATTERVVDAAEHALAVRDAIRAPTLELIAATARAGVPHAERHARDRTLSDAARTTWSAARRELEAIAGAPARIAVAPWPERVKEWPAQLDEPDAPPEPTLAELLELD
jgi:hypothetical protein